MRVRLDRYESVNRSMTTVTTILFVLGGISAVVAAFGFFLGFAFIAMPDKDEGDGIYARRGGIFVSVFFGVVPATASALMIAFAVRQRARYRRLGELAAVARQAGNIVATPDIARGLGTTPQLAERLVVDAAKLGLIEHGPPPDATTAPPPGHAATALAPTQTPASAGTGVDSGIVVGGTYRIEERLGRGGMGEVFAARHLRTGRRYAVKTILRGNGDEGAFRRFEREATAASALGHPGIVQVHDFNVTADGTFYLVMDLLEGETLDARIARGVLSWSETKRIALELCAALAAAHEHGLIHRDIKPSNVFLSRTKSAPERSVLVDFGLVKSLHESATNVTRTGAIIGTPMYMSPEQARGEPLDVRSDLYSLAAVVFEAATGAPPFGDRTHAAVYARLLAEPPPRASQVARGPIPASLDDVFTRALAKDRAARFPSARAFAHAIEHAGEDAPATERMA